MATKKRSKAKAAKAVQEAAREVIVGFNAKTVIKCFQQMADGKTAADDASETKAGAALALVQHAHEVALASREAGATDIDRAWSKNVKALYPQMAKNGTPFVKVTETNDETKYTLTGYGLNVNSIARGMCQYADIDMEGIESFGQARQRVQQRRADDLSPEVITLNNAKAELDDQWKAVRKLAIKGSDVELIERTTEALGEVLAQLEAMHEEGDDAEAIADAA